MCDRIDALISRQKTHQEKEIHFQSWTEEEKVFMCKANFFFRVPHFSILINHYNSCKVLHFSYTKQHLPNRKMARVHATFVYCIKSCEKTPFEKSFGNPQTFKFHQQLGIVFDFCFALNKRKTTVGWELTFFAC